MIRTKKTQMSSVSSKMQTLAETRGHLCRSSQMVLLFEKSRSLKSISVQKICSIKAQPTELLLITIIIPPDQSSFISKSSALESGKEMSLRLSNPLK